MQHWTGVDQIDDSLGRCVVTIGMFDGVHRGHARVIAEAVAQAAGLGVACVLVTFEPHPLTVLGGRPAPARLTTAAHKADLVAGLGVEGMLVLPFDRELAELSAQAFVDTLLVDRLHAAGVVVGANFRFGRGGTGTVETLRAHGPAAGFTATGVALLDDGGAPVSATRIRSLVDAGSVEAANDLLGHPFRCDGVIVRGEQRGRELGYPTANVDMAPDCAVTADGVYAGTVVRLSERGQATGQVLGTAAISVGTNPTFEGRRRTVEAYILDFDDDLYGDRLGVEFRHRLRGMVRFDSIDALVVQMAADVERTRELVDVG